MLRDREPSANPPKKMQPNDEHFTLYAELVTKVLSNDDITPKAKTSLLTAINLLKFIEANIAWIAYAVGHKQDSRVYRYAADKAKGVLRDFNNTSFHINSYHSAEQVSKTFNIYLKQFKIIVTGVLKADKQQQFKANNDALIRFAHAFIYEDQVGCLEARLAQPMRIGRQILLRETTKLADIMASFYQHTPEAQRTLNNAICFIKDKGLIGNMVINDQQECTELTEEHIRTYCVDTLCLTEKADEDYPHTTVRDTQQKFIEFSQQTQLIYLGYHGMIQFHFKDSASSEKFVSWCQQQDQLQSLQIHKAKSQYSSENQTYIVRLTPEQCQTLYGADFSFERLEKFTEKSALINQQTKHEAKNNVKTEPNHSEAPSHQAQSNIDKKQFINLLSKAYSLTSLANNNVEICFSSFNDATQLSQLWQPVLPIRTTKYLRRSAVTITKQQLQAIYSETNSPIEMLKQDKRLMSVSIMSAGRNYLSECARTMPYHSSKFEELINKASTEAISQALIQQDYNKKTAMHYATLNQSKASCTMLINKASPEALTAVLSKQEKEKKTVLHLAAVCLNSNNFVKLVSKVTAEALNATILKQDDFLNTVLHLAAHVQSANAFSTLIAKTNPDLLSTVMIKRNRYDLTVLDLAARHQPAKSFINLIAKVSDKSIDLALTNPSSIIRKPTALHIAACHQSAKAFIALIARASPKTLNQAANHRGRLLYKSSLLEIAAKVQPGKAFAMLISKLKADVIKQASLSAYAGLPTVFYYTVVLHDTDLLHKFITDLDKMELAKAIVTIKSLNVEKQLLFFKALARHLYTKNHSDLLSAAKSYFTELRPFILELYFNLKQLPGNSEISQMMIWHLMQSDPSCLNAQDKAFIFFFIEQQLPIIQSCENYLSSILDASSSSKGKERLAITHSRLAALFTAVNKQGQAQQIPTKKAMEIRNLIKLQAMIVGFKDNTKLKLQLDKKAEIKPPHIQAEDNILRLVHAGNGIIKIIKPKHWPEMLRQLCNYSYRPKLRKKIASAENKFKFVHLTEEIIPYRQKRRIKANFQHTKKTSATLIAKELCTPVFGHHQPHRDLIGLLFDAEQCIIKAMLSQDVGTYRKSWVDHHSNVETYGKSIANFNFFKAKDFKAEVASQGGKVNEILVKVNTEALKAIIIARDTPVAREIALGFMHDLKMELGIMLPIYRYDFTYRCLVKLTSGSTPINYAELNSTEKPFRMAI